MDDEPITFLGRIPPPGCFVRTVVLPPGQMIDYRPADWADTLVIVESGTLELECEGGVRAPFGPGSVITFVMVRPRRLLNNGTAPVVLSALTR